MASRRSSAVSSVFLVAKAAGGSHNTIEARVQTMERLVDHCYQRGFQINGIESIKGKHIASFINAQRDTHSTRALQNQMSHIRTAMTAAGRGQAAQEKSLSNASLGIDGASRAGTKVAATDTQYREAVAKMEERNPSVAAALQLQRELGLRAKEAVMCGPSLKAWEKALSGEGRCLVVHGTKGGRDRQVDPPDRAAALEAVRNAIQKADENGGRLMEGRLDQALATYHNEMSRHCEITGHQLRYAFAQESVDRYVAQGESLKTAYAMTSVDLGHGDGRGTWIKQVYDQRGRR